MSFWERDTFALIKDFASTVTLMDGRTFQAIYETKTEFYQGMGEVPISGEGTTLTADTKDVVTYQLKKGISLTVEGLNYKIKSIKNEIGITLIDLEKSK